MLFTKETLLTNSRQMAHWEDLWARRNQFNAAQNLMVNTYLNTMTPEQILANEAGGLSNEFWAEIDRQVVEARDSEVGMEIVNDLMSVQTILSVGKTANLYTQSGDISDDVTVSLDGQAPYSFDSVGHVTDGDPIPVFQAGYGVNWREAVGLETVGVDKVLDSQAAKLKVFYRKVANYYLNGDANISVNGYVAQGLRNHRNTAKIDLTTAGIDLTTAPATSLISFFTTGAFGQEAIANFVDFYDVLWVSPQIMANLGQPHVVNGAITGSVLNAVLPFAPVKEVRMSYALKGNEFVAYQRRKDVVTPLVGMTTGVTPLPRPLPNTNYNFQILAALGLQVKADDAGRSGVVYGSNLT